MIVSRDGARYNDARERGGRGRNGRLARAVETTALGSRQGRIREEEQTDRRRERMRIRARAMRLGEPWIISKTAELGR